MGFGYTERGFVMPRYKTVTASGNPVTLEAAKRLRQLTIYGNAVQSNLPSGYTEVGYIESSGTQYINTGICPTNNTKVEVVFSADKNSVFVYGSRTTMGSGDAHGFYVAGQAYFMFGTHMTNTASAKVTQQVKYTVSISQDGGYLDGALKQSYDTMSFESVLPMYLCAMSNNGNVDGRTFVGKIYSFRVWESGELIQSLVPCKRDSDGAVGMYDTVTGTFLTNSGTGVFAAGAAVTPTPDTPVDIQLCGDRTGNLLDYNRLWDEVYYEGNFKCVKLYLKPNTQYTLSTNIPLSNVRYAGVYLSTNDTYISGDNSPASVNVPATVETDNSGLLVAIVRYNGDNFIIPSEEDFKNGTYWVMLNEGSEAQPYEPYGYKVSGRVEGVNLFDKDNATLGYRLTQDGVLHNNDGAGRNSFVSDYISVDPNTIYSLNYAITTLESTGYERVCFYDADKQFISLATVGVHTLTTPENASYLRLCRLQTHLDDTMLLKGSYTADTIPPYEPYQPPQDFAVYLPQQIAKVGDVADTVVVDFEKRTATLVQRTKEIVFDGTENWIAGVNVSNIREFKLYIDSIFRSNYVNCFSNRYRVTYATNDHCTYMAGNNPVLLHIADNSFTTTAEFKAWLSELYASGEPLKYLFELSAPVTTDITAMQDWDAMPQVKGTVTLTLSAEVEPSGAEAVYISSRPPKPKAQTISDVVINEADPEHTEAAEPEQTDEATALNIEMITYE